MKLWDYISLNNYRSFYLLKFAKKNFFFSYRFGYNAVEEEKNRIDFEKFSRCR